MFNYKSEFIDLVDRFHITDGTTRLTKAQELEDAFVERLNARILEELSPSQRDEIIALAEVQQPVEVIVQMMFAMVDDIDSFTDEVFEEFKTEFLTKVP